MKTKGSTLQRRRQVAEGVDFKLIEAITVLDKLAIECVQCRSGRVAMLKVDNRRLDPAGQKLFDHLGVVSLHVCQEQINFRDPMFGKKGLHRQRRHFNLLHLHLHSGCFRIVETANQGVFLEAGEHCQIGGIVPMIRDEQPDSAVLVRDGRVFKSKLFFLRVVFEKLLRHLRLRLDQYSMPVIFGHELPRGSSVNPLLAPIWTKKKSDRSADTLVSKKSSTSMGALTVSLSFSRR